MKKLFLIATMIVWTGMSYAQTEEVKDPVKPINSQVNENAAKGQEISNMATTVEGSKEKGVSISSAARRSTLMRERAAKGAEKSEAGRAKAEMGAENSAAGRDRAEMGAENAEAGKAISNQARSGAQMRPEIPAQARPNVTVPQSRPNAPVVRPNNPTPTRPTPPAGRPTGLPGGGA